jgi:hypothetical protein
LIALSNDFSITYANSVEASSAIKNWLSEQDAICPFGVNWPNHRKVERDLKEIGFAEITVSKLEPHCVYVIRGRIGKASCRSSKDLQRIFKKLGRNIGFAFRAADTASSFSRGRFRVVLCLPNGSDATEIVPNANEEDDVEIFD